MIRIHRGWTICGEATTGREAVELAKSLNPHLVMMDISMPDMDGAEATRQILKAVPEAKVLVLSMHENEEFLTELLAAGAHGFVTKSDAATDLIQAMSTVLGNKPYLSSSLLQGLLESYGRQGYMPTAAIVGGLTPREREVARLLGQGESNKEIAAALHLSPKTVETHRANLMRKLGLHSIADLVHYTIRKNLVDA